MMKINDKHDIAKLIDYSLLRPDATGLDIMKLCKEAEKIGCFAVCVQPVFVPMAKEMLMKSKLNIATVIGFPMGMTFSQIKTYEAMEAVLHGADELDIVMNVSFAKSNNWKLAEKEISDIITATPEAVHKVIIETCYLTDDEKRKASLMVTKTGATFVKTSTGFACGGAVVGDVELIRSVTKGDIGIKAAGGINTLKDVMAFVDAGATRIGTSSGVAIMKEVDDYLRKFKGSRGQGLR